MVFQMLRCCIWVFTKVITKSTVILVCNVV
jgi:hypothetical protein